MRNFKSALIPLVYGALVLTGGVVGYLKAQSLISLICGLFFGLGLIGASLTVMRGIISGHWTAIGLTIVLTLFFHYRFATTQVFMPAGMMAIISVLALIGMFIYRPVRAQ